MTILRVLEKVEMAPDDAKRIAFLRHLFMTDKSFAKYMDTCYSENPFITELPIHQVDDAPAGMNYSNLEKSFDKFHQIVYDDGIKEETRKKMFVQILESIHPLEIELIKHVIKGRHPIFTKEIWEEYNGLV